MLSKLHNSIVALTLLFSLVGTFEIATSSESNNISRTTIAQTSTEEIAPQTDDNRRGTSWYWLLLLLIPLGLGGVLLARRTRSSAEVRRDEVYTTTNANTPTTTADKNLSPSNSEQIANVNPTSNGTATINRIEDETILTTGLTAYDIVGERQAENREEVIAKENESSSVAKSELQTEDGTDKPEITPISDNSSLASEDTDRERGDLFSELETSDDSQDEISLEEITFEESNEDLADNSDEEDRIFDWLESLDDSHKDDNLDEISEWLNSLDSSESANEPHFSVTTIDFEDTQDTLSEKNEELSTSDNDTFQELQDLLDGNLKSHQEP